MYYLTEEFNTCGEKMRILVLLDPTNRRGTKMKYTELRKFLFSDGYLRIGTELFMRVTPSRKSAEKHIRRLSEHDPGTGNVRVLKLTEKQYEKIWYLTGGPDEQEAVIGRNYCIML